MNINYRNIILWLLVIRIVPPIVYLFPLITSVFEESIFMLEFVYLLPPIVNFVFVYYGWKIYYKTVLLSILADSYPLTLVWSTYSAPRATNTFEFNFVLYLMTFYVIMISLLSYLKYKQDYN